MRGSHFTTVAGKTILPKLGALNSQFNIILASGSPRRRELVGLMGLQHFQVLVSDFAEDLDKKAFANPVDYCLLTAQKKVESVIANQLASAPPNTIVIGADTIVVIDGIVLEKPADDQNAKMMMMMLSGHTHLVHTAVTLYTNALSPGRIQHHASFIETTDVTFADLKEEDMIAYIASGEGRDKAGGYGIQGLGGQLVQRICGCYFNVMGLPIHALSSKLADLVHEAEDQADKEL
ncbi:septum formation protein Maf [archaeon]|nr:MAG: septum formation protein Maf [archaeon]